MFRVFILLIPLIVFNSCLAANVGNELPILNVVTEDWPPYNYQDSHGKVVGTATKQIENILQLANINYNIKLLPWARAFNTAINNPNTLIYSIYRIKERESLFHWFCPLFPIDSLYAYALKENAVKVDNIDALKNFTIAVSRNEVEHAYLSRLGFKEGVNLYISAEDEISFDHMLNKKVELFVESPIAIKSRLKKRGLPSDFVVPVFSLKLENVQHCFALSRDSSPEIIQRVTEAFEELQRKNGIKTK